MSMSENSVPKPLSFSASVTPYPAASFGMGRIIDHPRVTPYPAARFGVFFLHFVEFIDPYWPGTGKRRINGLLSD